MDVHLTIHMSALSLRYQQNRCRSPLPGLWCFNAEEVARELFHRIPVFPNRFPNRRSRTPVFLHTV